MSRHVLTALICLALAPCFAQDDLPYPQGRRFPLGLYSIGSLEEMQQEQPFGWHIAHTYSMKPDYLDIVKSAGWLALAHLEKSTEPETQATITDLVSRGPVAWWDFPEELRYWYPDEMQIVKDLSAWTRRYDPQQRPNFMYHAGHYQAEALANYVPYLDIIGAGAYTEYSHMPRAWVRWRMEETIRGIERAGAKIGPDYLNGERTPIGIPMLFYDGTFDVISPVEAYHDFYSCLAAGARGILVFSYYHKRDAGVLEQSYEAYAKAAREVSGPEGLGQALLFGGDVPVAVEITDGPTQTVSFRPHGTDQAPLCFPSVNVLGKRYQGRLYIIAVNSNEEPVKARLTGLPDVQELRLPFEKALGEDGKPTDQPRRVKVTNGAVEDAFGWLGVHVYIADLEGGVSPKATGTPPGIADPPGEVPVGCADTPPWLPRRPS